MGSIREKKVFGKPKVVSGEEIVLLSGNCRFFSFFHICETRSVLSGGNNRGKCGGDRKREREMCLFLLFLISSGE